MDRLIDLLPELCDGHRRDALHGHAEPRVRRAGGLLLGLALYATRAGSLFPQRALFGVLNVLVNTFRPIPFIILLAAVQPLARALGIRGIGIEFGVFAISLASMFAIGRIVEQNLLTVRPGVIEAARAAGASRSRILFRLVPREALGPLDPRLHVRGGRPRGHDGDGGRGRRRRARRVRDRERVPPVQPRRDLGRRAHHHRHRPGRAVPRERARPARTPPLSPARGRAGAGARVRGGRGCGCGCGFAEPGQSRRTPGLRYPVRRKSRGSRRTVRRGARSRARGRGRGCGGAGVRGRARGCGFGFAEPGQSRRTPGLRHPVRRKSRGSRRTVARGARARVHRTRAIPPNPGPTASGSTQIPWFAKNGAARSAVAGAGAGAGAGGAGSPNPGNPAEPRAYGIRFDANPVVRAWRGAGRGVRVRAARGAGAGTVVRGFAGVRGGVRARGVRRRARGAVAGRPARGARGAVAGSPNPGNPVKPRAYGIRFDANPVVRAWRGAGSPNPGNPVEPRAYGIRFDANPVVREERWLAGRGTRGRGARVTRSGGRRPERFR